MVNFFEIDREIIDSTLIIRITNVSDYELDVFKFDSIVDSPITSAFQIETENRILDREVEIFINRRNVSNDNILKFKAGESKEFTYKILEIIQQFSTSKNEDYYIALKSKTLRFNIIKQDKTVINEEVIQFQNLLVPSNLKFNAFTENKFYEPDYSLITKSDCPPVPWTGQHPFFCYAGHHEGFYGIGLGRYFGYPLTFFSNCNKVDIFREAILFISRNKRAFKVENNSLFKRWFGLHNSINFFQTRKNLSRSFTGFTCSSFTSHDRIFNLCYDDEGNEAYAVVVKKIGYDPIETVCKPQHKCHTLQLCSLFWNSPLQGVDSKIGTLVHEFSHLFANTKDFAYGKQACLQLAKTRPNDAIMNADSFQYFVEEYFGWK